MSAAGGSLGAGRRRLSAALVATSVLAVGAAGTASAAPAPGQTCAPAANTPYRKVSWAQRRLDPARVWMLTRGGGVTVAVLDTGVSRSAPALRGRVLRGKDVLTGGRADDDCDGHGTFVAGLVAARPVGGGATFTGIAPDARILPVRVGERSEDVHPDMLAKGIDAAVAGGAGVIAVVSTAPFGSAALSRAVARAVRTAVVVGAATTERNQRGDGAFPGALPGVLAVMPIGPQGLLPNLRPSVQPSLCAPSMELVGIGRSGSGNLLGSGPNLAVGYVAGTAALVRAYLPRAGVADVRDRVATNTDPVGGPDPDPVLGRGVLDPVAAVTAVMPAASERTVVPPAEDLTVPRPAAVDTRATDTVLRWTMLVLGVAIVVLLVGSAWVRARRRGWSTAPAISESDTHAADSSPSRA
ncbi:MAG TPA: S8 family serine peptidase [Mycobacteriales bacterium]